MACPEAHLHSNRQISNMMTSNSTSEGSTEESTITNSGGLLSVLGGRPVVGAAPVPI